MSTIQSTPPRFDDVALLLGRICMASLFLPSGIGKLLNFGQLVSSLPTRGMPIGMSLPFPEIMAVLAVAIEIGGPVLLLIGVKTRWVALVMIAFVIMASLTSHRYWELEGQLRSANSTQFYKNMTMIGGFLFLYVSGAGRWSWEGWQGAGQF